MIKIEKDISIIPDSLNLPEAKNYPGMIPITSKTTHSRRLEVINEKKYIDERKFNQRYKVEDIRNLLLNTYNNKCAFCEKKIEQYHVEHYRPKKKYYWLAFSWDNLLMSCATCNSNKGTHFEIVGKKVNLINSKNFLKRMNKTTSIYDRIEQPKMINPETTDPQGKIIFNKNGVIESEDIRFSYTIEKCKIDRDYLNDNRRKILDDFKKNIISALYSNESIKNQEVVVSAFIQQFIEQSRDNTNQFLAFRQFALSNEWLNEIIKEVTTG